MMNSQIFDALGNSVRKTILECLARKPQSVGDIAAVMPVTRSAVSQHLKILKDSGLIHKAKSGRRNIYEAIPGSLEAISDYAAYIRHLGSGRSALSSELPRSRETGAHPMPLSMPLSRVQIADESRDDLDDASEIWARFSPSLDPKTIAIVSRLLLVARIMGELLSRAAKRHGLRSGEAMILGTLRRLGEPFQATPTELSKVSIVAPPGVAKRLDRLRRLGLIRRVGNLADRRSHRVRLTAKGCRVADAIAIQNIGRDYASIVELPEHEKEQLADTLRYIRRHVQEKLG
jgi:DNA-binding MarR family transcriptional regulator